MICPMKFSSDTLDTKGYREADKCQCEKEECAWWSEKYERCWIAVESYEERASLICHQAMRDRK